MRGRVWRLDAEDADQQIREGTAALHRELGVTPDFPAQVLADAEEAAASPVFPSLDRTDIPW